MIDVIPMNDSSIRQTISTLVENTDAMHQSVVSTIEEIRAERRDRASRAECCQLLSSETLYLLQKSASRALPLSCCLHGRDHGG